MADRTTLFFPDEGRERLKGYLPRNATERDDTLPFVTLTFATSLDSALSLSPGTQTALSGPQSKAMTHYLRSEHDAIMIGVGTAVADNPSLNCRLDGVGGYGGQDLVGQPRPVVIDPRGRWQLDSRTKILGLAKQGKGKGPWIISVHPLPQASEGLLKAAGGRSIQIPSTDVPGLDPGELDWRTLLQTLRGEGIRSIMIEGGGNVINSLLSPQNAGLIDSVIVTIAPTWLGQGGVVVSPERSKAGTNATLPVARLNHVKWQQLGEDVVLCGYLKT